MKRSLALLVCAGALAAPTAASATHSQPPVDRGVLKGLWKPVGFFKPGDPIPSPTAPPPPDGRGLYNPSGHYSAFDTNLYETLNFPGRQAGDETSNDPPGSGDPRHGYCPPNPAYMPQGRCANHALEWMDHYERSMRDILGDFGGAVHRYEFVNPGRTSSGQDEPIGEPGGLSSPGGKTFNIAGIVPGADHPDQEIIVSGHWDFTDAAHAATWDSAEGHAEVMRMAKIMTDYWRATGTRPSATVKFMPWAAEESGTYGSQDYTTNYVADEDDANRIRAYFNVDPCAGAFPAFYHGNPLEQVQMVMQVTDPSTTSFDAERISAFNQRAEGIINEFWADIDDTVDSIAGPLPVFTDADRGKLVTAVGGLLAFSSDYGNFEDIGVPIMNLFPDMFGPHADGTPASSEGAATIHTPRDNQMTLNALTGPDQSGTTASDGWMTGMELCAHLESRYMLQPEMGGAQVSNLDPVAFFEVFKPKATKGKLVTFDGAGSYQYVGLPTRQIGDEANLQWRWDFGDGTAEAFGKSVKHAYKADGTFTAKLTLTNRQTGQSDTAERKVFVDPENAGDDVDPASQGFDPGLQKPGTVISCQDASQGFESASVRPAGRGLRFEGTVAGADSFIAEVFRVAKGRRATKKFKRLASFSVKGALTWNGKLKKGRLAKGTYFARLTGKAPNSQRPDVRSFGLQRGKKFKARKPFQRPDSCAAVSLFRLGSPAFGSRAPLLINFVLTKPARVTATVFRGKKRIRRFTRNVTAVNRLQRFTLKTKRKHRRGEHRIVLAVEGAPTETLFARKY